jgi:hypothetical protein
MSQPVGTIRSVRWGFVLPGGSAAEQIDAAVAVEEAGWGRDLRVRGYGANAWWIDARWDVRHHSAERHAEVMVRLAAGMPHDHD